MIIKRILLRNFGLYKGEHIVEFDCSDYQKVVTLIGGLNGRGKTTFLDSIILGLYGRRALKYLQDERIKYSTYIENHVTKGIAAGSITEITITLQESSTNDETITITRSWSKNLVGISDERLTAYRNGIEDSYLSSNWDYFVEEVLPLTISRFFFFDNEKIAQIADDESFDSVKDSIRALLGFTTIDQLITDMGRLTKKLDTQGNEAGQPSIAQQLSEIQASIDAREAEAKEAYDDASHYQTEILRLQKQLEEETEKFWKNGGNLGLEREKLEQDKRKLQDSISKKMLTVQEFVQDSATPLLLCRYLLSAAEKRQRGLEDIHTARYYRRFINHLLERLNDSTTYSEEFVQEALAFLHNVSAEYSVTDYSVTPQLDLAPAVLDMIRDILAKADDQLLSITELLDTLKRTKDNLALIESHLSREINENETMEARAAITDFSDRIVSLEVDKRLADERRAQAERERERLISVRSKVLGEVLLAQRNESESMRSINYANIVIQTMEAFKANLQEKKLEELSQKILVCFRAMVKKDSMIQNIIIDPVNLDIRLIDYTGGELLKAQLSAGEKQLFAVSIIWGLAQCSGYEMPVVIDTPLGRLDSQHRSSFVEGYLPNAGKQVIILSTDEEIYGKYYRLIRPYVSKEYTLVYNEEDKSTSIEAGYWWGDKE